MKVTYIKLINVAGLVIGNGNDELEIDFKKGYNKIVAIQAANSYGKSTLLSAIHPFAYVTSIDERSSLSFILKGKNGYKEIHYQDGNDEYIIKHHFKASKDSHNVKSYFMKNGEELNENGNVTSFNQLVELHFGLTQDMMRLIRLGSNVNSFVSLSPTKRKEYIGKLINELDAYLQIYRKINDDLKITKVLLNTNSSNLSNLNIEDINKEERKLKEIYKQIKSYEKDRDKTLLKIGNLNNLINDSNIDELRQQLHDSEASLRELDKLKEELSQYNLIDITLDQLISKRNKLNDEKLNIQSNINSYRLNIDQVLTRIDQLELEIKKLTSGNDIKSLLNIIDSLSIKVNNTNKMVINFKPLGSNSDDVYKLLSLMTSLNTISQNILTLGNKPLELYLKLKKDNENIESFIVEQSRKHSSINKNNIQSLLNVLFENDEIISPNCSSEYKECPYYRLSEAIDNLKDNIDNTYDLETLNYVRIINSNIDRVMDEIYHLRYIEVPDLVKDQLKEYTILSRLKSHLSFFDTTNLSEYLSILKEYEIYKENLNKLKEYQYQLSIYHKSGVENTEIEIVNQRKLVDEYNKKIKSLLDDIEELNQKLNNIDNHIALVTKYDNMVKHKKVYESLIKISKNKITPLENASRELYELKFHLNEIDIKLNNVKDEYKVLERNISEYKRLSKESIELNKDFKFRTMILEATSTKKGIPVIYMNQYLYKIKKLANELLDIIYEGAFQLYDFKVTTDTFEIPFIRNNKLIPDIKYGSQSEIALSTMALSFALATNTSSKYNVLLLDEIDAGLDENNRYLFIEMLKQQMNIIKADQIFIISHNLNGMKDVNMDCIRLSNIKDNSKLHNVIYE